MSCVFVVVLSIGTRWQRYMSYRSLCLCSHCTSSSTQITAPRCTGIKRRSVGTLSGTLDVRIRLFSRAILSKKSSGFTCSLFIPATSIALDGAYTNAHPMSRRYVCDAVSRQIDEAWEDVVMRTPHLHDTLMGDHSLEKTGMEVSDKGKRCTIYYSCDPASQAYVANYFATSSRWLSHRIGEQLRVKYASPCESGVYHPDKHTHIHLLCPPRSTSL